MFFERAATGPMVSQASGMKRLSALLACGIIACGDGGTGPSALYPSYFLSEIDGQLLPASGHDLPDGAVVLSAHLQFPRRGRPRGSDPSVVSYYRQIRFADQTTDTGTVELLYTVAEGELHIDLCPPTADCLVASELIGPADRNELVLTHYLANAPQSVYRFFAVLPD
jgi:hypothetical protein